MNSSRRRLVRCRGLRTYLISLFANISEIQDLKITKNTDKVTNVFLESFLSDMKTQFNSLNNGVNINEATEIAVTARVLAESNDTTIV